MEYNTPPPFSHPPAPYFSQFELGGAVASYGHPTRTCLIRNDGREVNETTCKMRALRHLIWIGSNHISLSLVPEYNDPPSKFLLN